MSMYSIAPAPPATPQSVSAPHQATAAGVAQMKRAAMDRLMISTRPNDDPPVLSCHSRRPGMLSEPLESPRSQRQGASPRRSARFTFQPNSSGSPTDSSAASQSFLTDGATKSVQGSSLAAALSDARIAASPRSQGGFDTQAQAQSRMLPRTPRSTNSEPEYSSSSANEFVIAKPRLQGLCKPESDTSTEREPQPPCPPSHASGSSTPASPRLGRKFRKSSTQSFGIPSCRTASPPPPSDDSSAAAKSSELTSEPPAAPSQEPKADAALIRRYDQLLSTDLDIICKMGRCANHVWLCKHSSLPNNVSFVLKLAKVKRTLTSSVKRIWGRHLAILRAKPTPESCVVNVLGCCRASMNDLKAHPDLRACMEPDRQDEPCLFMVVERLPGTLLDFWLQFDEQRYCVFTATSFLRDLLRVCLWLEENSLYLYDFKLENFFVRADGRLVLGDLDTVFRVRKDTQSGRMHRNHSHQLDGIYARVNAHLMPFQAPEVRMACERLNADKHHAELVDYTKAHTWSCAAMIYYYLSGCVMPVGAKFNDRVLDRHLQELEFLCETADPRTNDQGVYISQVLSHMLDPDASVRWDTPTALKAVEARFVERQFAVDFRAKFHSSWCARRSDAPAAPDTATAAATNDAPTSR